MQHRKNDGTIGQDKARQRVETLNCSRSLVDPTVEAMLIIIYVFVFIFVLSTLFRDKNESVM